MFTKAIGTKIICMVLACTNGQTVDNMKVIMLMIKKMGMVFIPTPMDGVTKACGRMVNSMEREYL